MLLGWRVWYRLRQLEVSGAQVIAANSPPIPVATLYDANAAELRQLIHDAAQQVLDDPRVQAERARVLSSEQQATSARAGLLPDSAIPTVALGPGPGYLGAALALRDANRPSGFRQPHVFMSTPFSNSIVNEQQAVRGTGGVQVGGGRIPGLGPRRVNYDALVAEMSAFRARTDPHMSDETFARHVSTFAATGRAGGVFASTEGAGLLADFSRIAFSVETARSTSFAAEGPMLVSLVQSGELSVSEAFARGSAVNPLSMTGASAANRLYESRVQGLPDPRRPGRKVQQNYQEVLSRRRELLIRYIEAEMTARQLEFNSHAEFFRWAREELQPMIRQRAQRFFGLLPPDTSDGVSAVGLFGARQVMGQA